MNPQIAAVEVMPGYKLCVRFGNGESKLFDVGPYLNKGIFKELKDQSYLKKVRVISGGIEWPHEQDLSADTLYCRGVRIDAYDQKNIRAAAASKVSDRTDGGRKRGKSKNRRI